MKHVWKQPLSLALAAALSVTLCAGGLTVHAEERPEASDTVPVVTAEQGENIFLGKSATASSHQSANPPENALDGDETGTKWCAAPSSSQQQDPSVGAHWLQIDLGGLYTLDRIYFILEDKNNSIETNGAIYKYQIAVSQSEDITADDIVIDRSDNAEMIWTVDEDLGGVVCRYVRIYLNCATPRNWPCIMEAYGYGQPYTAPQERLGLTLDYDGTVQQGGTFQVPLTLSGLEALSEPVYLMQLELTYPEGFSCTGLQPADGIDGAVTYYQAPGETRCTVLYDANSFDTGLPAGTPALFTATFAVAADTAPDTYAIHVGQEPLLISTMGNILAADLTAASVTVEEASQPVVTYTVTFETNGGTPVDSQSVAENGTVAKPADPVRDGFTFDGWYADQALEIPYDFSQAVTSDLTLYAGWQENEPEITYYTVSFETNGGSSVDSQSVAENGTVAKPADPVHGSFTFNGWY
ncbi:InlB B-repeat-containing protein, partial [Pseudoflavonifractor phocaeensis]|uniref:InlB B-repeat-containing protein n=1 Tax=Pseudoflavonifractor phocaeensis TaxID=1870988 RepID=UPI00195DEE28